MSLFDLDRNELGGKEWVLSVRSTEWISLRVNKLNKYLKSFGFVDARETFVWSEDTDIWFRFAPTLGHTHYAYRDLWMAYETMHAKHHQLQNSFRGIRNQRLLSVHEWNTSSNNTHACTHIQSMIRGDAVRHAVRGDVLFYVSFGLIAIILLILLIAAWKRCCRAQPATSAHVSRKDTILRNLSEIRAFHVFNTQKQQGSHTQDKANANDSTLAATIEEPPPGDHVAEEEYEYYYEQ